MAENSIEKEFLDFLGKNGGGENTNKDGARRGGDSLDRVSNHGGGGRGPRSAGGGDRRAMMTKSLSKEDLKVDKVDNFFADFEEGEFDVDWEQDAATYEGGGDEPTAERKARLARSRRLGPGDRRKELNRRSSSRRQMMDSNSNGDDGAFSMNTSRRGLNRRTSNRSLMSTESNKSNNSNKDLSKERPRSKRDLFTDTGTQSGPASNKMTVKSLREDLSDSKKDFDMSFSDLPKDWQVSTNPAAASFLPSTTQRAPNRTKSSSNNPRHRRNSLTGGGTARPQLGRRQSSRGVGSATAYPSDGPSNPPAAESSSSARRTPRRHSLMGNYHGGEGMHRQRSSRGLAGDNKGVGDHHNTSGRRTTTIPRRGSANGACNNDMNSGDHRQLASVSNDGPSTATLTGETIAAIGGATIRW